jgi:hypothetical protein
LYFERGRPLDAYTSAVLLVLVDFQAVLGFQQGRHEEKPHLHAPLTCSLLFACLRTQKYRGDHFKSPKTLAFCGLCGGFAVIIPRRYRGFRSQTQRMPSRTRVCSYEWSLISLLIEASDQ